MYFFFYKISKKRLTLTTFGLLTFLQPIIFHHFFLLITPPKIV